MAETRAWARLQPRKPEDGCPFCGAEVGAKFAPDYTCKCGAWFGDARAGLCNPHPEQAKVIGPTDHKPRWYKRKETYPLAAVATLPNGWVHFPLPHR